MDISKQPYEVLLIDLSIVDNVFVFLHQPCVEYNLDYCFGSIDFQFGIDRNIICASMWLIIK